VGACGGGLRRWMGLRRGGGGDRGGEIRFE